MSTPVASLPAAPSLAGTELLAVENAGGTAQSVLTGQLQTTQAYDYVVYPQGGAYYARNDKTGAVTTNAAFHTIVESILVGARTVPLSVAICGECDLTAPINVPDWTDIHILGTVTNTGTGNVFANDDAAGGNTNIRFFGPGTIDAGATDGTNPEQAIQLDNVTHCRVSNLTAKNSGSHVLDFTDSTYVVIDQNTVSNSGDDLISVVNCTNATVRGNTCTTTRSDRGTASSSAIEIEDGTGYVIVSDNCIYDVWNGNEVSPKGDGIHCIVDPGDSATTNQITISGNIVRNSVNGIDVSNNDGTARSTNCTIANNIVENTKSTPLKASKADGVTFIGNVVKNCDSTGISVSNSVRVSIIGNVIDDTTDHAISLFGSAGSCQDVTITGNQIHNAGENGAVKHGVQSNGCEGLQCANNVVTCDNSQTQRAVNIISGAGLMLVTGTHARGITSSVVNGTCIGNDASAFDATNVKT